MTRPFTPVALAVALSLALLVPFVGCKPASSGGPAASNGEVRVAVSFPALYCFAANVVGDVGTVTSVKSTQGAHGSEVSAAERQAVESADLLFINGLGLDDTFAKKLKDTTANTRLKVVTLGDKIPHDLLLESDGCPCGDADHKHDHGDHDPHVWLGPDIAKRMVEIIRRELSDAYPAHKEAFAKNAAAYTEKLTALKAEGKQKLSGAKKSERKLVTVHGSMNYFASAFDVTVAGVVQTTAGKEPSVKELTALIEACKKEQVKVIAAEPQFSTRGAVKTLQESLGADLKVIELDPLETATPADLKPDWYETRMRANIDAVAGAFAK
jgi:ABC-type Zn uptake system ZnuABC Zn-binding protein ZnuA